MPEPPVPRPDSASPHRALLRQILELLVQAGPAQPTAVGIARPGDDVQLAVRPLDGPDVVDALTGYRAPTAWDAFAVVAPGTAHHVDGGPSRAVVLGALAARDGTTTATIVSAGGDDAGATVADEGDGRVLDACRRVLGLPTPSPAHGVAWWAAVHWVDAIARAVIGADLGTRPPWATLRRLDDGGRYATRRWSQLREACATGRVRIPELGAHAARWMDDGLFSREALAAYPPLRTVLADLRELLPRATYEQLLQALCDRLEPCVA
jgi:hypothetical protein